MHASLDELLAVRDGESLPAPTRLHVRGCERCTAEIRRLRATQQALLDLPALEPPPDAWAAIGARAGRTELPASESRWRWVALGLAATLVAAIALQALPMVTGLRVPGFGGAVPPGAQDAPAAVISQVVPPSTSSSRPVAPPELAERSRRLEAALAALPSGPRVVNAGTATTIATLEERLAWIDYRLGSASADPLTPEQARDLWQRRVYLMNSLVNVRYAQAQRASW